MHRQFIFTGIRLGLYDEVKQLFAASHHGEEEPVAAKVASALAVSAIGIAAANPSDVIKVRPAHMLDVCMSAAGSTKL